MEPHDLPEPIKPGLPEAVNPAIGNGALWETGPHQKILRSVDNTTILDFYLLDQAARESIVLNWEAQLTPSLTQDKPDSMQPIIPLSARGSGMDAEKPKRPEKKIVASAKAKTSLPDWLENDESNLVLKKDPNNPEISDHPDPSQEMENSPSPPSRVEGKRVRKAVKKAKKAAKLSLNETEAPKANTAESHLSPYTKWLKSLRGSEYVHPYEDDYGLIHSAGSSPHGISETFADLLVLQGYKEQAIDMYKLLMAKYPEKSSFFAAKIEALK